MKTVPAVRGRGPFAATRRGSLATAALALVVGWAWAATAQIPVPPRPSPPRLVNDYAGLLAPAERDALERKLVAFSDSTSTQIAVVAVRTLDGGDPAMFATELGEAWGVGGAAGDNGIVILVAVEDRDVFIATGRGAEGPVPDAIAARIVRDIVVPSFREGRFYAGLDAAAEALMAATRGEFSVRPADDGGRIPVELIVVLVLLAVILISFAAERGGRGGGGGRHRRGPGVIFVPWGGGSSGSSWASGGGWSSGGGGFSGGFGGFGGGSFGGGGAGGSW